MEIGSEFEWIDYSKKQRNSSIAFLPECEDYAFTFSGRTAIETIFKDAKNINRIAFPSYCCDSMLDPCIALGIEFVFYDVFYDGTLKCDFNNIRDCDAIFICNYFGFDSIYNYNILDKYKKKGAIIIEDITHSLLSEEQVCFESDYLIASIRKWFPILSGGLCCKKKGQFSYKPDLPVSQEYIINKTKAMKLKREYLISGELPKKDVYLNLFRNCNTWLAHNYSNMMIDKVSYEMLHYLDYEEIRAKRIANSEQIYKNLESSEIVELLFKKEKMDCPLFIPVIVKQGRDGIRKKLIDNQVYAPVHWPHPNADCNSNLYDMELSLVCDQRYTQKDMERIVSVISNIF